MGQEGAWVPMLALDHPPKAVCKRNCYLVQATVIVGSLLPVAQHFLSPLLSSFSLSLLIFRSPHLPLPSSPQPTGLFQSSWQQGQTAEGIPLPSPWKCITCPWKFVPAPRALTGGSLFPPRGVSGHVWLCALRMACSGGETESQPGCQPQAAYPVA